MRFYFVFFSCFLYLVSCVPQKESRKRDSTFSPTTVYTLPQVDRVPILSTCEQLKTTRELTNCLYRELHERIDDVLQSSDYIVDIKGIPRVSISFVINREGEITNIQSVEGNPSFYGLAEDIVKQVGINLKNENSLQPAEKNNMRVNTRMQLEILFK